MTEETGNQEVSQEQSAPAVDKDSVMGKAMEAAERLEAANAKTEKLIERQEALAVQNTLGGSAKVEPPEKKEESDSDYAKRALAGDL